MTPDFVTCMKHRPVTAWLVLGCLASAVMLCGGGCRKAPPSAEALALEKKLGIALYPAAKIEQSGMVVGPKAVVGGASLSTTDNYADVVKFYRDKYVAKATVRVLDEGAQKMTLLSWRGVTANCTIVIKRDEQAKRTLVTLALTGPGEQHK